MTTNQSLTGNRTERKNAEPKHLRLKARIVLSFLTSAMIVATVGLGSATASASTPQYTGANCGWFIRDAGLTSPYYYKITSTNLPYVTGTSATPTRVYLTVRFYHRPSQQYRSGAFYTDAVAGRWSTSWTSLNSRTSGWTSLQDANGESGYTGAEFTSLDTFVLFHLDWYNSALQLTNYADQWAYSPNSSQNHNVCNAGANFA